jgi:hypothetical protein
LAFGTLEVRSCAVLCRKSLFSGMISVVDQILATVNLPTEAPSSQIAQSIAKTQDHASLEGIFSLLSHANKKVQRNAMRVIYKLSKIDAALLKPHLEALFGLLKSKQNRMVWSAMISIDSLTEVMPEQVYERLETILSVVNKGSVIVKDHTVGVLAQLAVHKQYHEEAMVLLIDLCKDAPVNQFPTYCERIAGIISPDYIEEFKLLILSRLEEMNTERKASRLQAILKKWSG